MSYMSKKGCFKCGNLGHIAEACSSDQRLCYNCRQPGHESAACPQPRTVAAKQCYCCGGVGHIQAECPSLRVQGGGQKCYSCGRFGHIARACPNNNGFSAPGGNSGGGGGNNNGGSSGATGPAFASRAPPPGRGLNTASLPPVKCFRCGGFNHMSKDCLAAPGTSVADQKIISNGGGHKDKICYKCSQQGHIARECPQTAEYAS